MVGLFFSTFLNVIGNIFFESAHVVLGHMVLMFRNKQTASYTNLPHSWGRPVRQLTICKRFGMSKWFSIVNISVWNGDLIYRKWLGYYSACLHSSLKILFTFRTSYKLSVVLGNIFRPQNVIFMSTLVLIGWRRISGV